MIVSDERAKEMCRLTPSEALGLLDKGRAGDPESLALWSVYSIYRTLIRAGAAPVAAVHHTLEIARGIDIQVVVKH